VSENDRSVQGGERVETKVGKGAMRATNRIMYGSFVNNAVGYKRVAEIIEAETSASELAEALRELVKVLKHVGLANDWPHTVAKAEAVLAKHGGSR